MILVLNPVSGLSGDMLLGALIGLGAPVDAVRDAVASTGIAGWRLDVSDVTVGGLAATRATVTVTEQPPERRAAEIRAMVGSARPGPVASMAVRAVEAIASVEAALHRSSPDDVHLHELGGVDTVVDTVGVAAAMHALGVTDVRSAPIALGQGRIRTAHGLLPAPAPATLALLASMPSAVVTGTPAAGETVTPTGAALLVAMGARFEPAPAMTLGPIAYGAGRHDFGVGPNVLQAYLGSPIRARDAGARRAMTVLATNVDDVTGEILGHVVGRCLAGGAADAWITPAVGKKGRPCQTVQVLCLPEDADRLERLLLAETGTLGVRRSTVDRTELPRQISAVDVDGHRVRIKSGPYHVKPEYDDAAAAAAALGRPLRDVLDAALRAHREAHPDPADPGSTG